MLNLTKYAVVHRRPLTASGQDEIVATFILKKDAKAFMKSAGMRTTRYSEFEIRKIT